MPGLLVNTENLRNLATRLSTVHSTLSDAAGDAGDLVPMIPHATLAGAVQSFTNDWDRHRKDLAEKVDQLQQRTSGAADAFDSTDGQLADKLEEAGSK